MKIYNVTFQTEPIVVEVEQDGLNETGEEMAAADKAYTELAQSLIEQLAIVDADGVLISRVSDALREVLQATVVDTTRDAGIEEMVEALDADELLGTDADTDNINTIKEIENELE